MFQDSVLMHARNLLEFTRPIKPRWGWWIVNMGAPTPVRTSSYDRWVDFINAKVTHLGEGRLRRPPWPVPEDDERLVTLSKFVLKRIQHRLPTGRKHVHAAAMRRVAQLGLDYLHKPTPSTISALAGLVEK